MVNIHCFSDMGKLGALFMNDLKFIFCNTYRIPSGLMFIPARFDHVKVSEVMRVKSYIGNFAVDETFLIHMCDKNETVNEFAGLSLSSYYVFIGNHLE